MFESLSANCFLRFFSFSVSPSHEREGLFVFFMHPKTLPKQKEKHHTSYEVQCFFGGE